MAYTRINFKTKKALKEALASGQTIEVYQEGPFGPGVKDGICYLEGPHYPAPHTWYGKVTVKEGKIVGGVK